MTQPPNITLPPDTDGVVYFVDEAGSKGSLGDYFVTAAVRTTNPDLVSRKMKAIRDQHGFTKAEELKFNSVTRNSAPVLANIFRGVVECGCTFGAFVLDKRHFDPWSNRTQWQGHLFATERLLRRLVTRREVAIALHDHIDVPEGVSYGDNLVSKVNTRFGNKRLATAVSLDSRTSPGLQIADLLASAVFHARKNVEAHGIEGFLTNQTPKARLSREIATSLGSSYFADCKSELLHLQTSHERSLHEVQTAASIIASADALATG